MTLGKKIAALRAEHKMSQGDLAEKLNVSRQSVSKWETDASIPELDKLVALSDLFGITLDELVKDAQPEEKSMEQATAVQPEAPRGTGTQKILGYIFLSVGLLCGVLGLVFSRTLPALCLHPLMVGIVCLTVRKYAVLVIGWLTVLPAIPFVSVYTRVNLLALASPAFYQDGITAANGMAIGLWLALIALIGITVWAFRKRK